MRNQLNKIFYSILICTSNFLLLPAVHAQYISDEQQKQDEQKNKIEAEHTFYQKLEGQTFWFQPGKFMRARFYPEYQIVGDGDIYLSISRRFSPEKTVSFVVEKYIPSRIKDYGPARHIYRVRIEDGMVAYMPVTDFGYPSGRDLYLTDEESAVHPLLKSYNDMILTKSPEVILAVAEEKKILKAKVEEKARLEKSEKEEIQRLASEQERVKSRAAASAQKRKGGVQIGMAAKQVLNSNWGKPSDINRTTTVNGVTEQWVYGVSSYLYFTNGKLTAIQN